MIPNDDIHSALCLLPERMDTPEARVMLLAIGLQESRFRHRRQMPVGPARGFWQFEQGGGVAGVLRHEATRKHAQTLCTACQVEPLPRAVWEAIEHDDTLAAGFARLLLWSDPRPLPKIGDAAGGWDLYTRTWRPGKPHPQTWPALYAQAVDIVTKP